MSNEQYWVSKWLDYHRVSTLDSARLLLENPVAIEDLRDRAANASKTSQAPVRCATSILAGREIDLSGRLSCTHIDCRKRQVDTLFSHVWHYFDQIVVEDAVAHEVSAHWDSPPRQRNEWLLGHIELLLYLKRIGAESLLEFREKPIPCEVHWQRHAKEAGLGGIIDSAKDLCSALLGEGRTKIELQSDGSAHYRFDHPEFKHTVWDELDKTKVAGRTPEEIRQLVAASVLRRHVAHLTSDVAAARKYGIALGAAIGFHERLLRRVHPLASEDVAFQLELPVLNGLRAETLIAIRRDEQEYFARFRDCLRLAIQERVRNASSHNSITIAKEIKWDLIQPQLNRINERLAESEKALNKKSAVGVFLGALTTTCGLLIGMPPVPALSAGTAVTVAVTATAAAKHIDERHDVSLSEMYFLWKAHEHAQHTH